MSRQIKNRPSGQTQGGISHEQPNYERRVPVMTMMSNNVDCTTKAPRMPHRHEKLRAAMRWHGLSIKDLAKSLEISESALRRRFNGQVSFGFDDCLKLIDTLKLSDVDRYFRENYEGELVTSIMPDRIWTDQIKPGAGLYVSVLDPWEVEHGKKAAIKVDGQIIAGPMINVPGEWSALIMGDNELIGIEPEDLRSGRVEFIGEVKSVFWDMA